MTFSYYYTPCFSGPVPDENGDPTDTLVKMPGIDTGSGVEYMGEALVGTTILKYDDAETRCVVKASSSTDAPGWAPKSTGQVLTDYPGLPGVV
ncbi:hypothetical protein N9917_00895 [Deltaproteobacteria bacterium]|nr:hypothetical protein [Deltaproteobacteria bacterium]